MICEELEFRTSTTSDNEPTFVWRDLQGDVDELYEFVAAATNEPTRAFFETCMYRAMYERKYRRSADNTQDSDLQEFIWQYVNGHEYVSSETNYLCHRPPEPKKPKSTGSRKGTGSQSEPAPAEEVATASSSPQRSAKGKKAAAQASEPEMPSLFAGPAELFLWDTEHAQFEKQADVVARVAQNPAGGAYDYWLVASTDEGQLLAHRISSDMNQRLAARVLSFTWNYIEESGAANSWCLRFDAQEEFEGFQRAFSQALWEGLNQLPWGKAKVCFI